MSEKVSYNCFQTPKSYINQKQIYSKPIINHENILDRLFYSNKNKEKENYEIILNNIDIPNNTNESQKYMRNSVGQKKVINNMKQNNYEKRAFNRFKEKKELITPQKQRNTYTSSRPKSSFLNNENKRVSVYERLYEQNLEKRKRQEERIKENINEIKERANHPIQKNESQNSLRNLKKNKNSINHNNRLRISYEINKENKNLLDKKYVSNKIDKVLFNKSAKNKKAKINENRKNNINDQKRKDGQNFIESQRKCIELFNNMIEKEEKE